MVSYEDVCANMSPTERFSLSHIHARISTVSVIQILSSILFLIKDSGAERRKRWRLWDGFSESFTPQVGW